MSTPPDPDKRTLIIAALSVIFTMIAAVIVYILLPPSAPPIGSPTGTAIAVTTPQIITVTIESTVLVAETVVIPVTAPATVTLQPTSTTTSPPPTPTSTPIPRPTRRATSLKYLKADSNTVNAGQCTMIRWTVPSGEVYLDNRPVPKIGSQRVCPQVTTTYRLDVDTIFLSMSPQEAITIIVQTPMPRLTIPPLPTDEPTQIATFTPDELTIRATQAFLDVRSEYLKVQERFKLKVEGQMAFNPPSEMTVGETQLIELQIGKPGPGATDASQLTTRVVEGLQGPNPPTVEPIGVTDCMSATLDGIDKFGVNPKSDATQFVEEGGVAYWAWLVTAKEEGRHKLLLTVALRIRRNDGECSESQFSKLEQREVTVRVRPEEAKVAQPLSSIRQQSEPARSELISTIFPPKEEVIPAQPTNSDGPLILAGVLATLAVGGIGLGAWLYQHRTRKGEIDRTTTTAESHKDSEPIKANEHVKELPKKLAKYFDEDGLKGICFELGEDYDFDKLAGSGTSAKALSLVKLLNQKEELDKLIKICERERPNVQWIKASDSAS